MGIESEELTEVISIHASREGSDLKITGREEYAMLFQSTFPAGEATTTSARSEDVPPISIHASRGGSDLENTGNTILGFIISIHASRGGSD